MELKNNLEDESTSVSLSCSSSASNNDEQGDLAWFLGKNKLPCYANVNASDENNTTRDLVYLYKEFKSNCLFAKSYSNLLENYLLHQRPSYVPSEVDLTYTQHSSASFRCLFSDLVTIPLNYPGIV